MLKNVSDKTQRVGWDGDFVDVKPGEIIDITRSFRIANKEVFIMEDKLVSNHRGNLAKVTGAPAADSEKPKPSAKPEAKKQAAPAAKVEDGEEGNDSGGDSKE